jgi:hypothetical protein
MSFLSAAASIGGALLGRKSASEANAANMRIAENNIALQKQFAKQGIRWKVKDAKSAGIHPLYALGASTHSFSPVNAFQKGYDPEPALSSAGQNLSRAMDSTATKIERLQVRNAELEVERNEVALAKERADLRLMDQPGSGPPGPDTLPPGAVPDIGWAPYREGIYRVPLDVPKIDEFGNPVFLGPATVNEPYRRSSHQDFEDYYGDLPSEVWSAGNIARRLFEWRR